MKKRARHSRFDLFLFFFFLLVMIVLFLYSFVFSSDKEKDYSALKLDATKEFIITSSINDTITIPQLNVRGDNAKSLNQQILIDYQKYQNKTGVSYFVESYESSPFLSIVLEVVYTEEGNTLYETTKYYTYNYDLKSGKWLSDSELLKQFDVSMKEVDKFLENKFLNYYYELVEKEKLDSSTCNYQCFLSSKEIEDYTEVVSFSVEQGSLVVYRPFVITPINYDYKNFSSLDFRFVVVK